MNEIDKYVKQTLHFKDYIRYCDDFCFFRMIKMNCENKDVAAGIPG